MGERSGFTLLLVIGAITVGALLSAWAAQTARNSAANVTAMATQVRLAAAADGALSLAAWQLGQSETPNASPGEDASGDAVRPDGSLKLYTIGTTPVSVRLVDETALVDLNQADADALAAAFWAAGLDVQRADQLAVRIQDWRDGDSQRRPGGAEAIEYTRADQGFIGNRAFRQVEEVREVLGMDGQVFEAVRPFLTVAGTAQPDVNLSPLVLRQALDRGRGADISFAPRRGEPSESVQAGSGRYTAYLVARSRQGAGYAEAVRFDRVENSAQLRILSRRRLSLDEAEAVFSGADVP